MASIVPTETAPRLQQTTPRKVTHQRCYTKTPRRALGLKPRGTGQLPELCIGDRHHVAEIVSVQLRLKESGILGEYPSLSAYVARGEAQPADKPSFEVHLVVFAAASTE